MPDNPFAQFNQALKSKEDRETSRADSTALPKGVVLGPDGKPCRTCTSSAAWMAMMKGASAKSSSAPTPASATAPPDDCPPDIEVLGRSTWTLLHSLTATYPTTAPAETQSKTSRFLTLFSEMYPCWVCAEDFRSWMSQPGNQPKLKGQDEFGEWMCRAHNAVNVKLGKEEFDCRFWKRRWVDGMWGDGRCG